MCYPGSPYNSGPSTTRVKDRCVGFGAAAAASLHSAAEVQVTPLLRELLMVLLHPRSQEQMLNVLETAVTQTLSHICTVVNCPLLSSCSTGIIRYFLDSTTLPAYLLENFFYRYQFLNL